MMNQGVETHLKLSWKPGCFDLNSDSFLFNKTKFMTNEQKLSKNLSTEFCRFFNAHAPSQFSSKLRSLIFDYLDHELSKGMIPLYLDGFLWSLNDFFDLLDMASKEFKNDNP
jgi:hypothetical protein